METINTKVNTDNVSKHTQGKWECIEQKSISEPFIIKNECKEVAIVTWGINKKYPETFEEVTANAALIVKAVNNHYALLEALTNMVAFYEGDANLAYIDKAKELLNSLK